MNRPMYNRLYAGWEAAILSQDWLTRKDMMGWLWRTAFAIKGTVLHRRHRRFEPSQPY